MSLVSSQELWLLCDFLKDKFQIRLHRTCICAASISQTEWRKSRKKIQKPIYKNGMSFCFWFFFGGVVLICLLDLFILTAYQLVKGQFIPRGERIVSFDFFMLASFIHSLILTSYNSSKVNLFLWVRQSCSLYGHIYNSRVVEIFCTNYS